MLLAVDKGWLIKRYGPPVLKIQNDFFQLYFSLNIMFNYCSEESLAICYIYVYTNKHFTPSSVKTDFDIVMALLIVKDKVYYMLIR